MKKYIGGFFEIESDLAFDGGGYHKGALALSYGRSCLNFILNKLRPKKVYLPFFSCDALLQPILEQNLTYAYYSINLSFEIEEDIQLQEDECLIYVNFFALKTTYCQQLYLKYGSSLIIDNTQAFFTRGNNAHWSFNSARKFFGVPDGGYVYGPNLMLYPQSRNTSYSCEHLYDRKAGHQELAFLKFQSYERSINCVPNLISAFSENILSKVNYSEVAKKIRRNYQIYENAFFEINQLKIKADLETVPNAYPLIPDICINKDMLYQQGIFIPTFWYDVINREVKGYHFERTISTKLLPLPVDHRYNAQDCQRIIDAIQRILKN